MELNGEDYAIIFVLGSLFGTTTLVISDLSRVLFKTPLCLSPLSLKNFFKSVILNGGTITAIAFVDDVFKVSDKIKNFLHENKII